MGRKPRARLRVIRRYVGSEFALSFLVAFLFFFVVFFVNQVLLMAEDILSKRAPVKDVLLLLLYALPSVAAISFPFGSLVGALMAAGRLSAGNEILVLQASGVPLRRVFAPFVVLGFAFSLLSFAMNDYFLPLGTLEFGKLYRRLVVSSPALELKPWSSRKYEGITIVTGAVKGGRIEDVLIFDRSEEGRSRVISAAYASIAPASEGDMALRLEEVWTQTLVADRPERFEWSSCDTMEYRVRTRAAGEAVSSVGPREMSSYDLARAIAAKREAWEARVRRSREETGRLRAALAAEYRGLAEGTGFSWENAVARLGPGLETLARSARPAPPDRGLQVFRLEFYKKFSIPFGALCFVFVAFPAGIRARRAGRAVGFGVGLLIAVAYWAMLLAGQTLGSRLGWSPFWSMWAPNILVLAAGAALWTARRLGR